jgi:hypothetical protein
MLVILAQILVQLRRPIVLRLKCSGWNATQLLLFGQNVSSSEKPIEGSVTENEPAPDAER